MDKKNDLCVELIVANGNVISPTASNNCWHVEFKFSLNFGLPNLYIKPLHIKRKWERNEHIKGKSDIRKKNRK
jgi:hypothetical protein